MTPAWTVYALSEPSSRDVRYVGWTSRVLSLRLAEHIQHARIGRGSVRKGKWIRSLLAAGLSPVISALETGTGDNWESFEKYWIGRLRPQGLLLNAADGGAAAPVGRRIRAHNPAVRMCWCMECRNARRGRPIGRPRLIHHGESSCRCVECRRKGLGRSQIKIRACSWCQAEFGAAEMRRHIVVCPSKPPRRINKGRPVSDHSRIKMAASARRRGWTRGPSGQIRSSRCEGEFGGEVTA